MFIFDLKKLVKNIKIYRVIKKNIKTTAAFINTTAVESIIQCAIKMK